MAKIDVSSMFPWNKIKEVTVDGQTMVKIPKFYVRKYTPTSGSYKGKPCWEIADNKADGFHVHPAFMHNGVEIDYFYIGAFEASVDASNSAKASSLTAKTPWVSIDNPAAISACAARNTGASGSEQYGWHLQNIYERSAISLLMMIELGTPNVQTAIGAGNVSSNAAVATGSTAAKWRGIHEFWGNVWEHTDGATTDTSSILHIFSTQGDGTYVSTGVVPAGGWIKKVSEASGTNFDLNDVFIPVSSDGTESNGTFSDYCGVAANCVLYQSGYWPNGSVAGAFVFHVGNASSFSYAGLGFRVAKWDI